MAAGPRLGMFRIGKHGLLRYAGWQEHSWLAHGFSTRHTGDFMGWPSDRVIARAFGADGCATAMLRQVHSDGFVRANRPWGRDRPAADAVLTDRPGVMVGVRTADCVPILLMDPQTRSVAAVHAGWRGTVAGVVPSALRGMASEFGSSLADIEAVVGPGIGACCFEVGDEVACQFREEFVEQRDPRSHVDLTSAIEAQLAAAGVRRIASVRECTSCDLEKYFSHRAERGNTGRMLAAAAVRVQGVV